MLTRRPSGSGVRVMARMAIVSPVDPVAGAGALPRAASGASLAGADAFLAGAAAGGELTATGGDGLAGAGVRGAGRLAETITPSGMASVLAGGSDSSSPRISS